MFNDYNEIFSIDKFIIEYIVEELMIGERGKVRRMNYVWEDYFVQFVFGERIVYWEWGVDICYFYRRGYSFLRLLGFVIVIG